MWRKIPRWSLFGALRLARTIGRSDADVISFQYVPHAYGRWGINLSTPLALWAARRLYHKPIVVTCHELYLAWDRHPLHWPLSFLHDVQLLLLMQASMRLVVVAEGQRTRLQHFLKWVPATRSLYSGRVRMSCRPRPLPAKPRLTDQRGIRPELVRAALWSREPRGGRPLLPRLAERLVQQDSMSRF